VLVLEAQIPIEVMGYITTRLADEARRPAIVIAQKSGDEVMAEARGPYGFDLVAAFRTMSGLFLGYGGHPRAAGFSARPSVVPEFRRRMLEYVAEFPPVPPPRQIDAAADLADLTVEAARELERLEPFGFGNGRAVLLARGVTARSADDAARRSIHLGTPGRLGRTPRDVVYRVRPAGDVVLIHVIETVEEIS
jgi:single-stranded-DNA-specific exonuclease